MERSKIEEIVTTSLGDRKISDSLRESILNLFVSRFKDLDVSEENLKQYVEYCLPIIDNNAVEESDPLGTFAETGKFEEEKKEETEVVSESQEDGELKAAEPVPTTEEKKEEVSEVIANTAPDNNVTAVGEQSSVTEVSEASAAVQEAQGAVEQAVQEVEKADAVASSGVVSSDIQAQIDALKAENERIASELAKKTAEDLHDKRLEEYKTVIAPLSEVQSQYNMLLDTFEKLTFAGAEDYNAFIEKTKVQVNDILQDLANRGLQMTAPGVGTGGDNNFLAEQIKAKTSEILKNK